MITKMFTVYDSKADLYLSPFSFKTPAEALRGFTETANDPASSIGKHPEDYILFEIGTYDDQTGQYVCIDHKSLGKALDYVKAPLPQP